MHSEELQRGSRFLYFQRCVIQRIRGDCRFAFLDLGAHLILQLLHLRIRRGG